MPKALPPDLRSIVWPVTPIIPPVVSIGQLITSAHQNQVRQALSDLWTNLQALNTSTLGDPTTTKGDLIVRGDLVVNRLAVGGNGQVLLADSAQTLGMRWATFDASTIGAVPTTRQVIAGEGMSGGGPLTGDVTLNALVTSVLGRTGDVVLTAADISGAGGVPATRSVIAGPGLNGGGPLTADVTLNADVTSVFGRTGDVVLTAADVSGTGFVAADDTSTQRVQAAQAGTVIGTRHQLNFIAGSGTSFNIADNAAQNRVDITVSLTGSGPASPSIYAVNGTVIGTRPELNLIAGVNTTISGVDNAGGNRVDITVTSAAGGQNQSPWTQNIDGANYLLGNAQGIGIGRAANVNIPLDIRLKTGYNGGIRITADDDASAGWTYQAGATDGHIYMYGPTYADTTRQQALGIRSTKDILFVTGAFPGTERVRLTEAGQLGIGKTPAYTIDAAGDVNITGTYRVNGVPISTGGGSQSPWTQDHDAAGFKLVNTGNVGIGNSATVTPDGSTGVYNSRLIAGSTASASVGLIACVGNVTGGAVGTIGFANYSLTTSSKWVALINGILDGGPDSGAFAFFTWNAGVIGERMRIGANGNIGVGISNPGNLLEVAGTQTALRGGAGASIRVRRTAADRASSLSLTGGVAGEMVIGVPPNGDDLVFAFENGSAALERMRLTSGGNLGIGTSNPGGALHVVRGTDNIDSLLVSGALRTQYLGFQSGPTYGAIFHWTGSGYGGLQLLNRVGVGTVHPTYPFQVSGGRARFDSNEQYAVGIAQNGQGAFWIGATASANPTLIFFNTSGVERMRIQDNGNVGISNGQPLSALSIMSPTGNPGSAATANQITICEGTNNPDYRLALGYFFDGTYKGVIRATAAGPANGYLLLQPDGGVCGVGTTTPSRRFQVTGDANTAGAAFYGGAPLFRIEGTGSWTEPMMEFYEAGSSGPIACIAAKNVGGGAGDLIFLSRTSGGTATEHMRVLSNGGIRIGQNANPFSSGDLAISRDSAPTSGVLYFGNGGAKYIHFDGSDFQINGGRIFNNGTLVSGGGGMAYVQINATAPMGPFQYLNFTNSGNVQWSAQAGGTNNNTAIVTAIGTASDARLKTNVRDLVGGLSFLGPLRPKEFEWNGLGGMRAGERGVSLVAQDLGNLSPASVYAYRSRLQPDDAAEIELLRYEPTEITMHLVLAVQQLEARLKALEAKVN